MNTTATYRSAKYMDDPVAEAFDLLGLDYSAADTGSTEWDLFASLLLDWTHADLIGAVSEWFDSLDATGDAAIELLDGLREGAHAWEGKRSFILAGDDRGFVWKVSFDTAAAAREQYDIVDAEYGAWCEEEGL